MERREPSLREAGPADGPARFLRELRQLRKEAGLADAELAARAHYPCEAIRAAEAGPALPDLPVLSAYVRSCGGAVAEWEERWRTLTCSPALPLLSARTAGYSDAAAAGARIGPASPAADGHDPALIMAALSRVANGIAAEPAPLSPSVPEVPSQDQPAPGTGGAVPAGGGVGSGGGAGGGGVLAPEPGSLFGDDPGLAAAAAASPVPPIAPASVAHPVPGTDAAPGAGSVPAAGTAPWDSTDGTPATNGPQAPSVPSPASVTSAASAASVTAAASVTSAASVASAASPPSAPASAAPTRSALRSKPALAAIIVLLCLIVVLVALLSLRAEARTERNVPRLAY